jgi:hypothetical protein
MESMIDERGRYSAESVWISRATFNLNELDRLADRSRALANDILYLLRQYYFYHAANDPEKKKLYRNNIETKFYTKIRNSPSYTADKKERALEILEGYFEHGLRALKGTVPTIMKFMESYDKIGYTPCPQQIVKSICETFISHL